VVGILQAFGVIGPICTKVGLANQFSIGIIQHRDKFNRMNLQVLRTYDNSMNNPCIIQFAGLKNGEHKFDYVISDAFFSEREYSEVKHALIHTHIILNKETNLLVFDIKMEGTINVMCDRCGDNFDFPVWGERKLIVSLTNSQFEEDDEIIYLPLNSSEFDLSQTLYEYIILLLPQRRIHPDNKDGTSGCNPEALKLLNKISARVDKNKTDPRWEMLKNIKPN
jgi:uncharacterized metal-binding protein YceD (DUF177 family)